MPHGIWLFIMKRDLSISDVLTSRLSNHVKRGNETCESVTLSYISGLSESIRRVLAPLAIQVTFHPFRALQQELVHPDSLHAGDLTHSAPTGPTQQGHTCQDSMLHYWPDLTTIWCSIIILLLLLLIFVLLTSH